MLAMRKSPESDWMEIHAEQVNFCDEPTRLFYIESSLSGVPFEGLHVYLGGNATMRIKVASLFEIVDAKGEEMNRGETVTLLNDMCMWAPATLISPALQWETIDSLSVKATFTNGGCAISAKLLFNEDGQLIDFISDDRYLSVDGKKFERLRWSTPVKGYRESEGRRIIASGDAVWHTPTGNYTYAKFNTLKIEYNVNGL
jgi:hypothetical protein